MRLDGKVGTITCDNQIFWQKSHSTFIWQSCAHFTHAAATIVLYKKSKILLMKRRLDNCKISLLNNRISHFSLQSVALHETHKFDCKLFFLFFWMQCNLYSHFFFSLQRLLEHLHWRYAVISSCKINFIINVILRMLVQSAYLPNELPLCVHFEYVLQVVSFDIQFLGCHCLMVDSVLFLNFHWSVHLLMRCAF